MEIRIHASKSQQRSKATTSLESEKIFLFLSEISIELTHTQINTFQNETTVCPGLDLLDTSLCPLVSNHTAQTS